MLGQEPSRTTRLLASICFGMCLVSANSWVIDPKIAVERAPDQNSLIVRFSQAKASAVELRLDGKPFSVRDVAAATGAGEVAFEVDPNLLSAGNHKLEVVLYSKAHKKLGSLVTSLQIAPRPNAPIMVVTPKYGEQIQGTYQIEVHVLQSIKKPYISLFVDQQFREMRNVPPYRFLWDTTKESNGWHNVEAWAYDDAQETFKSTAIQAFVNNPGGRTDRVDQRAELGAGAEEAGPTPSADILAVRASGTKGVSAETTLVPRDTNPAIPPDAKAIAEGILSSMTITAPLTEAALTRSAAAETRLMGVKLATPGDVARIEASQPKISHQPTTKGEPSLSSNGLTAPVATGSKTVASAKTGASANFAVRTAPPVLPITVGTHLKTNYFGVFYNGRPLNFDVAPRTIEGVPVAPFRHLFEYAGGSVKWDNRAKSLAAEKPGTWVNLRIGDLFAKVNGKDVTLEMAAFLESGRTIVPLSFMRDALSVDVDYDPASGHVLITSKD